MDQYYAWMNSERFGRISTSYESWDHATAMRIETSQYLKLLRASAWSSVAEHVFLNDLKWALNADNIKLNNHGVFVLRALLLVARVGESVTLSGGERDIPGYAIHNLMKIVHHVYDHDGWCAENSPQYDRVWLFLLDHIWDYFGDFLAQASARDEFKSILDKAKSVVGAQLYKGGYLVPRGDTQRLKTSEEPLLGTHYNTRVGIWTYATQALFCMATAGHASITHKHVDDTQLLLSYKGVDFFIDGGFHGHIYGDKRIPALKSSIGHSVLSVKEVDTLPPWQAYSTGTPPIQAETLYANETTCVMQKVVKNDGRLRRTVDIEQLGKLYVTDSWSLEGTQEPIIRFLVPTSCYISWGESHLTLTRAKHRIMLQFDRAVGVDVTTGESEPPFRGWSSNYAGKLQAAHCIEIRPSEPMSVGSLTYTIQTEVLPDYVWQDFLQSQLGRIGGAVAEQGLVGSALWEVDGFEKRTDVSGHDSVEIDFASVGDTASEKAGVLEIAFYDLGGNRIEVEAGTSKSPTYGDFTYVSIGAHGRASGKIRLEKPAFASYLILRGHEWQNYRPLYFTQQPVVKGLAEVR